MKDLQIGIAAVTSIILFIFGLENFSKEINKITGHKFRNFIGKVTNFAPIGVLIGAVVTAVIQSSSATSVIAIGLVNAGVISFKNSIGIIFGSNIGTTVTSQLIAFKLTSFAPIILILGFCLNFVRSKYSIFAKSLFYFGFVFFSLNLVSSSLEPLKNDPRIVGFLLSPQNAFLSIFIGMLITAVIQSSSVTTGLAIILTQQGMLSVDNAVPILMGANVGTTVTALIAIVNMDIAAKKTAFAHFFFNAGGVVLFLPVLFIFKGRFAELGGSPAVALANFHLIFNLGTTFVFLIFQKPFTSLVHRFFGEGKMDFERINLDFFKEDKDFKEIEELLKESQTHIYQFLEEDYSLITLSMETNNKSIFQSTKNRIEYMSFVKGEYTRYFSKLVMKLEEKKKIERAIELINQFEYLFQIHDSIKEMVAVKESFDTGYVEVKADLLLKIRELSGHMVTFFDEIKKDLQRGKDKTIIKTEASKVQNGLNDFNRTVLLILSKTERDDAGLMLHFLTHSQRLKDKLYTFYVLKHGYSSTI